MQLQLLRTDDYGGNKAPEDEATESESALEAKKAASSTVTPVAPISGDIQVYFYFFN